MGACWSYLGEREQLWRGGADDAARWEAVSRLRSNLVAYSHPHLKSRRYWIVGSFIANAVGIFLLCSIGMVSGVGGKIAVIVGIVIPFLISVLTCIFLEEIRDSYFVKKPSFLIGMVGFLVSTAIGVATSWYLPPGIPVIIGFCLHTIWGFGLEFSVGSVNQLGISCALSSISIGFITDRVKRSHHPSEFGLLAFPIGLALICFAIGFFGEKRFFPKDYSPTEIQEVEMAQLNREHRVALRDSIRDKDEAIGRMNIAIGRMNIAIGQRDKVATERTLLSGLVALMKNFGRGEAIWERSQAIWERNEARGQRDRAIWERDECVRDYQMLKATVAAERERNVAAERERNVAAASVEVQPATRAAELLHKDEEKLKGVVSEMERDELIQAVLSLEVQALVHARMMIDLVEALN